MYAGGWLLEEASEGKRGGENSHALDGFDKFLLHHPVIKHGWICDSRGVWHPQHYSACSFVECVHLSLDCFAWFNNGAEEEKASER